MGQINLYKIEIAKQQDFLQVLTDKLDIVNTIHRTRNINNQETAIGLTLYMSRPAEEKSITWNWLLDEFDQGEINSTPNPKAVVLVEFEEDMYAVTFGFSYFLVDKFCNRDFGFSFARKLDYKEIKTTTLTTPNSKRNKTVNTFVNYNDLEFDSGESFSKLKAKVDIPEGFTLHKESIEVGTSIKFTILNNTLEEIINIIINISTFAAQISQ